jgi:type I restriction enzyme R subunit
MPTEAIPLGQDNGQVKGPTAVGTSGHPEDEESPISEIIKRINERFGTDFTEKDGLFLEQVEKDAIGKEEIRQTALANPFDKFSLSIRQQLPALMMERMAGNDAMVTRCLNDPHFREIVFTGILRSVFETITAPQPLPIEKENS